MKLSGGNLILTSQAAVEYDAVRGPGLVVPAFLNIKQKGRQMTEIERLRSIVKTLGDTCVMTMHPPTHKMLVQSVNSIKERIADLEAQQPFDQWADAKNALYHWDVNEIEPDYVNKRMVFGYIRHLEAKVAELNHELRCERIDGGKVRDDLRARIAEMERHGRKVDQANHEHYGRLQDQIAIRDLKIEKLEGQLAGRPVSEAAEALVKEVDQFKQREKLAEQEIWIRDARLTVDFIVRNRPSGNPTACDIAHYARHLEAELAKRAVSQVADAIVKEMDDYKQRETLAELTTIANAIPSACGLAKELVQKRIEGVKREIQNNG